MQHQNNIVPVRKKTFIRDEVRRNYRRYFFIGCLVLVICFFIDISCGAVFINPVLVFRLSELDLAYRIFFYFHLPRAVTALIAGMTLSVCGAVLQTFFRNPLSDPYILGISAGACLGVASFSLFSAVFSAIWFISSWGNAFAAIFGALVALSVLLVLSFYIRSSTTLLLIGVIFGTFLSAMTGLIQLLSNPETLKSFIIWSMGSLNNTNWDDIKVLLVLTGIGLILLSVRTKSLNAMLLGEDYATTLGISLIRFRWEIIAVVGILSGAVTAFCGPISFIGMAIPHATRKIMNTNNHYIILPMSGLLGSIVLLLCDALTTLSGIAVPISIITSIIGCPLILYILTSSSHNFIK